MEIVCSRLTIEGILPTYLRTSVALQPPAQPFRAIRFFFLKSEFETSIDFTAQILSRNPLNPQAAPITTAQYPIRTSIALLWPMNMLSIERFTHPVRRFAFLYRQFLLFD